MKFRFLGIALLAGVVGGCGFDGRPLITQDIGTSVEDGQDLSVSVKNALLRSPQTAVDGRNINVSTNGDTVRLAGYVSDDATSAEAERVAGNVPGVRFVVNTLNVRR
ncbi:MAG: BON domain-containing protein [Granulosicoccus sp.]